MRERPLLKQAERHFKDKRMPRCPTCRTPAKPREENPAFPFCSPRCRAVDLGRWFSGGYVVPGRVTEREGGEPTALDDGAPPVSRK